MGLFGKKEKATFYKFLVVDGCVPSMSAPSTVRISLLPDQIEIRQIIGGKAVAYLSYSQVTAAAKVGEREIVETDKSVIGHGWRRHAGPSGCRGRRHVRRGEKAENSL